MCAHVCECEIVSVVVCVCVFVCSTAKNSSDHIACMYVCVCAYVCLRSVADHTADAIQWRGAYARVRVVCA